MDTGLLHLAFAEKELEDSIQAEMKTEWEHLQSKGSSDSFTSDPVTNFFPRLWCVKHKKHDKRERSFFKEEFRSPEKPCFCIETDSC